MYIYGISYTYYSCFLLFTPPFSPGSSSRSPAPWWIRQALQEKRRKGAEGGELHSGAIWGRAPNRESWQVRIMFDVYIIIYIYIHTSYMCAYVYIYMYVYTHTHIYIYTCVYIYMYIYIYVQTYIHIYIYTYRYTYIYMCVCICNGMSNDVNLFVSGNDSHS